MEPRCKICIATTRSKPPALPPEPSLCSLGVAEYKRGVKTVCVCVRTKCLRIHLAVITLECVNVCLCGFVCMSLKLCSYSFDRTVKFKLINQDGARTQAAEPLPSLFFQPFCHTMVVQAFPHCFYSVVPDRITAEVLQSRPQHAVFTSLCVCH